MLFEMAVIRGLVVSHPAGSVAGFARFAVFVFAFASAMRAGHDFWFFGLSRRSFKWICHGRKVFLLRLLFVGFSACSVFAKKNPLLPAICR